jgi:hypothetical protein
MFSNDWCSETIGEVLLVDAVTSNWRFVGGCSYFQLEICWWMQLLPTGDLLVDEVNFQLVICWWMQLLPTGDLLVDAVTSNG